MSVQQQLLQEMQLDPTKFSIPQIQQGVQNGVIPPYIGIPLIHEITRQKQMAQMAQQAQQPAQQPPVAQQVLAQAQQVQGIDNLPSNLPQQGFAPGGIVAFDGGGEVKRFQVGGISPEFGGSFTEEAPPLPPRTEDEVDQIIAALRARGESVGLSTIKDIQQRRGRFADVSALTTPPAPKPPAPKPPVPERITIGPRANEAGQGMRVAAPTAGISALQGQLKDLGAEFRAGMDLTDEERKAYEEVGKKREGVLGEIDTATKAMESPEAEAKRAAEARELRDARAAALAPVKAQMEKYMGEQKERSTAQERQAKGIGLLKAAAAFTQPGKSFFSAAAGAGGAFGESYEKYLEAKAKEDQIAAKMQMDHTKMLAEAERGDITAEAAQKDRLRDDARQLLNSKVTALKHKLDSLGVDGSQLIKMIQSRTKQASDFVQLVTKLESGLEKVRSQQELNAMLQSLRLSHAGELAKNRAGQGLPPAQLIRIDELAEELKRKPTPDNILYSRLSEPVRNALSQLPSLKPNSPSYNQVMSAIAADVERAKREYVEDLRTRSAKQ